MTNIGKGVSFNVEGTVMTIQIDLAKDFGKTGTGKNICIASSGGNVAIPGFEHIKMGLNVYKKIQG